MINLLFDPLPECVQVDGVDYPVATDFRDWIAFADLILDPGISTQNKVAAAMQWYPDARPPDATKALHALKWFFTAEPLLTGRQQRRMERSRNRLHSKTDHALHRSSEQHQNRRLPSDEVRRLPQKCVQTQKESDGG